MLGKKNLRLSGSEWDRRCCLGEPGHWCPAELRLLVSAHQGQAALAETVAMSVAMSWHCWLVARVRGSSVVSLSFLSQSLSRSNCSLWYLCNPSHGWRVIC